MSFTFGHLKPDDPYHHQWLSIRSKAGVRWVFYLFSPLPAGLVWLLASSVFHELIAFVCAAVAMIGFIALIHHFVFFPCPRCGTSFYRRGLMTNYFADNCMHCGLPEYAPHGDFPRE